MQTRGLLLRKRIYMQLYMACYFREIKKRSEKGHVKLAEAYSHDTRRVAQVSKDTALGSIRTHVPTSRESFDDSGLHITQLPHGIGIRLHSSHNHGLHIIWIVYSIVPTLQGSYVSWSSCSGSPYIIVFTLYFYHISWSSCYGSPYIIVFTLYCYHISWSSCYGSHIS
jgi:hypothetical protein